MRSAPWMLPLVLVLPGSALAEGPTTNPAPPPTSPPPEVVPSGLSSPDPAERIQAARLLGSRGELSAWPALMEALTRSSEPEVEAALLAALEKLNYTPEFLIGVLQAPGPVLPRTYAAYTLGRMKSREGVPALITCLSDPEPKVREQALLALATIGDPRAFEPILRMAHQDPSPPLKARAEQIATNLVGGATDTFDEETWIARLSSPDPRVRKDAAIALGQHGSWWAVGPLIKAIEDPNPEVRERAIASLSELGDKRAVPPLLKHLEKATGKERYLTMVTLSILEDESAVAALASYLQDPDVPSRQFAARSLGRLGSPTATPALTDAFAREPLAAIRQEIVRALGKLSDPRAIPTLTRALSDTEEIACDAGRALAALPPQEAATALMGALNSPNPMVRATAIDGLIGRSDALKVPGLREKLRELATRDPDPYAREAAIEAVITLDARTRAAAPPAAQNPPPQP